MRLMCNIILFCIMLFVLCYASLFAIGAWQILHQWGLV